MKVSEKQDTFLHSRLPIDEDENILAVYKHHWFAYVSLWIIGLFLVVVILGITAAFVTLGQSSQGAPVNKSFVFGLASVAAACALLFTMVPVYLRSQELVVLTEEAVLQILQPSLFASKTSQLNLAHIADVSVQRDFLGTILGYGRITIETPGEQNNYIFSMIGDPEGASREIIAAHENFQAAVESGRLPTTLGQAQPAAPQIDPEQYQQFLQYQQMVAQQKQDATGTQQVQPPTPTSEGQNQPPQQP